MIFLCSPLKLYQTKARMENTNTLFTLGEGDPDYDTCMEQLRTWTWDDAMTTRGHHEIMTILSFLEDDDDEVKTLARGMTKLTDEAIRHVARAGHVDMDVENASVASVIVKTSRKMVSDALWNESMHDTAKRVSEGVLRKVRC